jgi:3-oxoacyl-(acyl-carrier-protein) synthase III
LSVRTAIVSVGSALPDQEICTKEINRRILNAGGFELHNGLVERLTGVRTRFYRAPHEQSSDLAVRAARQALERADVSIDEIDLIIFAACTQDLTEPATANIVQEKLGSRNAQVFDVKNACNSFLNGLDVADSHIRAGKSRRALVVSGETLSVGIDWNIRNLDDLKSRIAALTLGDAGAAMVLEAVPEEDGRGILATRFRSYGEMWRLATVMAGGSMHRMDPEYSYFRSDSPKLREAAFELIPTVVQSVCEQIGWKPEDIDLACGHQVSKELVNGLAKLCNIPDESSVVTVTEYGNTAAASIPLALARGYDQGRLHRGSKVLLVGGAAGFSVGVIPLIW